MIELHGVSVTKSGRSLLKDINLCIKGGEHWVFQGPNGSGKTLLLQVIAGMLVPLSGTVHHTFITGGDWDEVYQQRQKKIHFIPTQWVQTYLGGFDGLFYQQRYYTMDEAEIPRVRDVFGEDLYKLHTLLLSNNFHIHGLLDLPLTRLSNGQLKKVIILRQLIRNIPRLLLLDYPFDGLDAESRRDLSDFIDDIAVQWDIQIVLTDHSQTLPSIINRRLVLKDFRIDRIDDVPPQARLAQYSTIDSLVPRAASAVDPVVEMQDLTIEYGGKKILSNLNWKIYKGERWALTGKNGSGKTTLFSLIYADHPMAYSQKVFLFGKRRGTGESIWDIKRRIGYFGPEQIHFLNPVTIGFSGREYIKLQPHKNYEGLDEMVDFFEAWEYIDIPIKHLSSGQLQMILLLNMFLDKKELLLLDEPFQFLDPDHHGRVTKYLNNYLDKDITLVLITHDEKDVARWTQLRKVL